MAKKKNQSEPLLVVFYRNPELGKVKTRLAAVIGDAKAYSIYLLLSEHTRSVVDGLPQQKALYYSDYVDVDDAWSNNSYQKLLQSGGDLGEKMENAFKAGFNSGYKSICIIGTDCLDLTEKIVIEAFQTLLTNDVVIGPAVDGGYYLLGMNYLHPELFKNKVWGSDTVLTDTLHDIALLGLTSFQLQLLNDIDRIEDLPPNFR
jgi:rSAM/selenodomain-associated transferase 1